MTKSLTGLALTLSLVLGATAVADPAADKQIAACEKIRTGIAKNTKCPDQAKAASELTCSAATAPQVKTLFDDCMKVLTANTGAGGGTGKETKCKGLDESGAELASATGATTSKCGKALTTALTAKLCDGKTSHAVKYQFQREDGKPVKSSLYCKKAK